MVEIKRKVIFVNKVLQFKKMNDLSRFEQLKL